MQEEAAKELHAAEGHPRFFRGIFFIPRAEGDPAFIHGEDTCVGDADPVGVASQIGEYRLGSSKGAFGVHHPFFFEQPVEQPGKRFFLPKRFELPMELQSLFLPEGAQSFDKEGAVHGRECPYRKDPFPVWSLPEGLAVFCKGSGGDENMQVGMRAESLIPGV